MSQEDKKELVDRSKTIETNRGLVLKDLNDMWRFSEMVVASGLAPKGMDKPASVVVAVQMGAELGMPPMASLQNVAVINGRPSVWGDAMLGVCRASGLFVEKDFFEEVTGEGEKMVARCQVRRAGGMVTNEYFSVADAKKAGLWGKAGPWTSYPKRMLKMRARAFALRDAFSDILRGFAIAEEAQDIPAEPTTKVTTADPLMAVAEQATDPIEDPLEAEEEELDIYEILCKERTKAGVMKLAEEIRVTLPEERRDELFEAVEKRCGELGRSKKKAQQTLPTEGS